MSEENQVFENFVQFKKEKGVADIVWVIDATSSMKVCIEEIKKNIGTFFNEVQKLSLQGQEIDWRMRFITYKDLLCETDTEPRLDNSKPFVSSPDEVKSQLKSINIVNYQGCDEPESMLDGLFTAVTKSDWRETGNVHRIIIVLTDASCHRELHESTVEENSPTNLEFVIQEMSSHNVKVFLWGPEFDVYRKLKDELGVLYTPVGELSEKSRYEGLKDVKWEELLKMIVKTISQPSRPPLSS